MKKFSDKRGSKEKIKSFEKLFNFICFLDSSDGGDGCGDLLCYGAVFEGVGGLGVERGDRLRWMDIGSEFGLSYWCWIFFWLLFGGFCCNFHRPTF